MARIVILFHPLERQGPEFWSIGLFANAWKQSGHEVLVASDFDNLPPGDLGFMHIDCSQIPPEYARAARNRYAHVINGRALDITKRKISRQLLAKGDEWNGPVVIKSDLNYFGLPEKRLRDPHSFANRAMEMIPENYRVLSDFGEVADEEWDNPEQVIERFLPEREGENFAVRTWFFLGDRERCRRFVSKRMIVKNRDIIDSYPAQVPDVIRAERERIGIDYGKFDFVDYHGRPVLLDANKTPGAPQGNTLNLDVYADLAKGIEPLLADL